MQASSLLRFLYNHNPFYAISTCFVLYGLLAAFAGREMNSETTWLLARMLTGYALLLAVTAYLVVKLGHVWEDARSLVLLVLLLFFAMSVGFDFTCVTLPETAWQVLLAGFGFAVAVTEGLLLGLRLKFPVYFRAPYYACLGLMFFYPLYVAEAARDLATETTVWRIYGFAVLSGVVTLLLIPAATRGAEYVRANGTPWSWPWYPWPAFVFLGLGLGIRIYALNLSFVPIDDWKHAFGWYFLTPLLFAWWCVLLVIGLAGQKKELVATLLWSAPLLLLTAIPGEGYWHDRFLYQFTAAIGAPLWLTLWGLTALYFLAWFGGIRGAEWGIIGSLLAVCGVDRTSGLVLEPISPLPLLVLGVMQLILFAARCNSARCLLGMTCLLGAGVLISRETAWQLPVVVIAAHAWLAVALLLGALFDDELSRGVRWFSALLLAAGGILMLAGSYPPQLPNWLPTAYTVMLAAIAFAYGRGMREPSHLAAGGLNVICSVAILSRTGLASLLNILGPEATLALGCGGGCFAIATIISAVKGGAWTRLWVAWWYRDATPPGIS